MIVVRWFGLDTVGCVVAIQLFLAGYREQFNLFSILGLSVAVSAIYIMDRYRDLMLGNDLSPRHTIYGGRFRWVVLSVSLLLMVAFIYWVQLDRWSQLILIGSAVVVMIHLVLLKNGWYARWKDLVVANVFAIVMMVGTYHLIYVWMLIACYTFYNLTIHRLIETGHQHLNRLVMIGYFVLLAVLLYINFGLHWFVIFWVAAIIGHVILVTFGARFSYWYEIGELLYAFPFLMMFFIHR